VVNVTYTYGRLHFGIESALRARAAVQELGGVAEWNPDLKDWSARFERIPKSELEQHAKEVSNAVQKSCGQVPRVVGVVFEHATPNPRAELG
jgi:hypothetical protein